MLTCTGVSFAHGSNDGQKGMGLIVLILVGILPGAYALKMSADNSAIAGIASEAASISTIFESSSGKKSQAIKRIRSSPNSLNQKARRPLMSSQPLQAYATTYQIA
jgi:hypothetical protein